MTRAKNRIHSVLHANLIPPYQGELVSVAGRTWLRRALGLDETLNPTPRRLGRRLPACPDRFPCRKYLPSALRPKAYGLVTEVVERGRSGWFTAAVERLTAAAVIQNPAI